MEIHRLGSQAPGRRHGHPTGQAASNFLVAHLLDDDGPMRELPLGFDTAGRLLEIVVLVFDDGREMASMR